MLDLHIDYPESFQGIHDVSVVIPLSAKITLRNTSHAFVKNNETGALAYIGTADIAAILAERVKRTLGSKGYASRIKRAEDAFPDVNPMQESVRDVENMRAHYEKTFADNNLSYQIMLAAIKADTGIDLMNQSVSMDILLNTPGGYDDLATMQLIAMQSLRLLGFRTSTYGTDRAISAGAHLLFGGERRYALPETYCLVHASGKEAPHLPAGRVIDKAASDQMQLALQLFLERTSHQGSENSELLRKCLATVVAQRMGFQGEGVPDYTFAFSGTELAREGIVQLCDSLGELERTFIQSTGLDPTHNDMGNLSTFFNELYVRRIILNRFPTIDTIYDDQEGLLARPSQGASPHDVQGFKALAAMISSVGLSSTAFSRHVRSF